MLLSSRNVNHSPSSQPTQLGQPLWLCRYTAWASQPAFYSLRYWVMLMITLCTTVIAVNILACIFGDSIGEDPCGIVLLYIFLLWGSM